MKKVVLMLVGIVFLVLPTGLFAQKQHKDTCKKISVQTQVGKEFTVTLEANPTTGYEWKISKSLDETIIKLIDSKYQRSNELIGGGGQQVWIFKAVAKGDTTIYLEYLRSWEKNVAPIKTAHVYVTVH